MCQPVIPLLGHIEVLMDLHDFQILIQRDCGCVEIETVAGFLFLRLHLQDRVQAFRDDRFSVQVRIGIVPGDAGLQSHA